MEAKPHEPQVEEHYRSAGLLERILEAVRALGKDPDALTPEDLRPVDEFHSRGHRATRDLAQFAALTPGLRVLDVGSGLGGPARYLASVHGCDVTGIDLMAEFCDVANALSERTGLADRTRFRPGNALALPFPDGAFECVWTIQAQMNIANKERFYGEIARVLQPGGRFIFQDICAGNGEPLALPVAWASLPEQSHLITPPALRDLLQEVGLHERQWRDVTDDVRGWSVRHSESPRAPGPLGMHLVQGDTWAAKRANSAQNLVAGRIAYVQGVYEKPA